VKIVSEYDLGDWLQFQDSTDLIWVEVVGINYDRFGVSYTCEGRRREGDNEVFQVHRKFIRGVKRGVARDRHYPD